METSENPAEIMTKSLLPSSDCTHFQRLNIYQPPWSDQEIDPVSDYSNDNALLTSSWHTVVLPAIC